jgi:Fe-Mn family superoxide dismutase
MAKQAPRRNHHEVPTYQYRCTDKKIFNNAAQHWNHSFYWYCISPFKSEPSG